MNLDRFRREAGAPSVPLTPLIDVLFLMIIFLVLGGSFDTVETVRLPEASGQPATGNASTLRLELRPDGRLWMEGKPLAAEDTISAIRALGPSAVLLLPDRQARVGPLMRWYDRIRKALGIPVQIGVRPPREVSPVSRGPRNSRGSRDSRGSSVRDPGR